MKYAIAAAILLVLAAIVVPNMFLAFDRAKEVRTVRDMRTIAQTIEKHAPLSSLPRTDGWGTPYEITIRGRGYSIRSFGSDRRRDANLLAGPHVERWHDIVLTNGNFTSYPVGL